METGNYQKATRKNYPATLVLFLFIAAVTVFAQDNSVSDLVKQLDELNSGIRQILAEKYAADEREFKEHYILTADIHLFNLRIGRLELGEVIISDRDSFSIAYDPPFEQWDTRYLSYRLDDSVFVDEVISRKPEKFIYIKRDKRWIFRSYEAEKPRKLKLAILQNGFSIEASNLIEFTRLLCRRRFAKIREVLFLAESYPVRLEKSALQAHYGIYNLKWDVHAGEERVRLHGVHLAGLETDSRFIPLGGILKVSFVGLLDVDLIGVIRDEDTDRE